MSYRDALKVFKLERELSDDETAFLNTLRKIGEMSDGDRELIAETLAPTPVKKPTTTRNIEHCIACNYTRRAIHHKDTAHKDYHEFQSPKSRRATSISNAIQGTAGAAGKVVDDGNDGGDLTELPLTGRCTAAGCGLFPDHNVHHLTSAMNYHPFESLSGAQSASG